MKNYKTQVKTLVTPNNIMTDKKVIDNDGNIGTIKTCDDIHNVFVEYQGGGSGLHCLIKGCNENHVDKNKDIEIDYYDPLYYID